MGEDLQSLLNRATELWIDLDKRDQNNPLLHYGNSLDSTAVSFNVSAIENHYLAIVKGAERAVEKYCNDLAQEIDTLDIDEYLEQIIRIRGMLKVLYPRHPLLKIIHVKQGKVSKIDFDAIQKYAEINQSEMVGFSKPLTCLKAYYNLARQEIEKPRLVMGKLQRQKLPNDAKK
ncbi:hypothetical protein KA107_03415 [Candidatus Pacearchaeota archaeon]|nr:hypothetical protein [Candidatus Pacearchaeota archaeon]